MWEAARPLLCGPLIQGLRGGLKIVLFEDVTVSDRYRARCDVHLACVSSSFLHSLCLHEVEGTQYTGSSSVGIMIMLDHGHITEALGTGFHSASPKMPKEM